MRLKPRKSANQVAQRWGAGHTIKQYWPSRIDLSNAKLLEDGGFLCWKLTELEEKAGEQIRNNSNSELLAASVWPFHQALSKASRKTFAVGGRIVTMDQVRLEDFERYFLRALNDPSWSKERLLFEESASDTTTEQARKS